MSNDRLPLAAVHERRLVSGLSPTPEQHQAVAVLSNESSLSISAYRKYARSLQRGESDTGDPFEYLTGQQIHAVWVLKDCSDEVIEGCLKATKGIFTDTSHSSARMLTN